MKTFLHEATSVPWSRMGSGTGCLLGNDNELGFLSSERVDAAVLRWTKLNSAFALPAFSPSFILRDHRGIMDREHDSDPEFLSRTVSCRWFLKSVPNFKVKTQFS